MLSIEDFRSSFEELTNDFDWEVEGFLDKKNRVHPIDLDTKVISTVFERFASPVIRSIAIPLDYEVETANQTTYPDFTLSGPNNHRIGLDIKTTYVRNSMLFTLGGYNSFLRNNTKNILYPYNTYSEHWILAFIYEQLPPFAEYDLKNFPARGEVPCPYKVKAVFIRHKHEITGLRAGSGNTKNIGSVKFNSPNDFSEVQGPFCFFENPKEACDHYWKSYESYKDVVFNKEDLLMHPEFKRFGPIFS